MDDTCGAALVFVSIILISIGILFAGNTQENERERWCAHHFELKAEYDNCVDKGVEVMGVKEVNE